MNKDEMEGKWEKAKGTVKDTAGEITGNQDLEAEGEAQHAAGEVQETGGEVRRKAGEVVEEGAEKLKGE